LNGLVLHFRWTSKLKETLDEVVDPVQFTENGNVKLIEKAGTGELFRKQLDKGLDG